MRRFPVPPIRYVLASAVALVLAGCATVASAGSS